MGDTKNICISAAKYQVGPMHGYKEEQINFIKSEKSSITIRAHTL